MFLDGNTLKQSKALISRMEKVFLTLYTKPYTQDEGKSLIGKYHELNNEFELNDLPKYFVKHLADRAKRVESCKNKLGFEAPISKVGDKRKFNKK